MLQQEIKTPSPRVPTSSATQPGPISGGGLNKTDTHDIKPNSRLYVRWEVTDDTLRNAFGKFGKVADARVVRGQRLRSFGFITFEDEAEASKAMNAMNGKEMMTAPLQVEFSASNVSQPGGGGGQNNATQGPGQQSSPTPVTNTQQQPRNQRRQNAVAGGSGGVARQAGGGPNLNRAASAPVGGRSRRARRRARGRAARAASGIVVRGNPDMRDPNYGKQVILNPNPIQNQIPHGAVLTLLEAGHRLYRSGRREPHEGRLIASLVLNVEPGKGPFLCDFRLGPFDLKLLGVRVQCRPNDVRVFCRVSHPLTDRSREVYFRMVNGETRHKFFELRQPNKQVSAEDDQLETYFVTIDSIILDLTTGLWKKLVLSLVSVTLPNTTTSSVTSLPSASQTQTNQSPAPAPAR